MIEKLHWLEHASFRLDGQKTVYFDPWKLQTQIKGKSLQTGFEFNEDISIDPKIWPEFNDYVIDLQFRYAKRWEEIKEDLLGILATIEKNWDVKPESNTKNYFG